MLLKKLGLILLLITSITSIANAGEKLQIQLNITNSNLIVKNVGNCDIKILRVNANPIETGFFKLLSSLESSYGIGKYEKYYGEPLTIGSVLSVPRSSLEDNDGNKLGDTAVAAWNFSGTCNGIKIYIAFEAF